MNCDKMVDKLQIYYDALVDNIESDRFEDFESSWMVETKNEFDVKNEELIKHLSYVNEDLRKHITVYYDDKLKPTDQ